MILNALRLIVEAIEAFGLEERVRFCSRTRNTVSMATSVFPCRKDNSAGEKEEDQLAYGTGGSYSPKGC
jgi:hypothetical protein